MLCYTEIIYRSITLAVRQKFILLNIISLRGCSFWYQQLSIEKKPVDNTSKMVYYFERRIMNLHDYCTLGGKNIIKDYLGKLPKETCFIGYAIRHKIMKDGIAALACLNTRQLYKKLWEIKFSDERIMYVAADDDNIYFLHICKKQKGKTEKFELNIAISRAKELALL